MTAHVAELEKDSGFTLGLDEEKQAAESIRAEEERKIRAEERKHVAEYWGVKSTEYAFKSPAWWRDTTQKAANLSIYYAHDGEDSTNDQYTNARNIPLEPTCATCLWVPECALVGVTAETCQFYALELHPPDDMEAKWRRDHRRMNGGGPNKKKSSPTYRMALTENSWLDITW